MLISRGEIMRFRRQIASLFILSTIFATVIVLDIKGESDTTPYDLIINGLVDHPSNFSYSELQSLPMISEVARLKCVGGPVQVYNWTGIPLFFLLSVTGIRANAMKVVFYGEDNFSSSLTVESAMHPTTLIALQANGTALSYDNGYPYRLVVPCKYGYKWVRWITKIEVVDYNYLGTYESRGYSDDADVPGCSFPSTIPPFETFNIVLENTNYSIITLSNSTIDSFNFDAFRKQICINITGSSGTRGFCYVTIPKTLLWCDNADQWTVKVDKMLIVDRKVMEDSNCTYIYFTCGDDSQEIQIKGDYVNVEFLTDLSVSPLTAVLGDIVDINATLQNKGDSSETFNVTLYANSEIIGNQTVSLGNASSTTISFMWNTTYFGKGDYVVSASASVVIPDEVNTAANSKKADNIVTILYPGHDIAVADIAPLKTAVGQGSCTSVTVTVKNYGIFDENINTTFYVNTTAIQMQSVTLASGYASKLIFMWNTSGFVKGNYTMSAVADTAPGETYIEDNTLINGTVYVGIPGDVNADGKVDMRDISYVARRFWCKPDSALWDPNADFNSDDKIDMKDIALAAKNFGKHDP